MSAFLFDGRQFLVALAAVALLGCGSDHQGGADSHPSGGSDSGSDEASGSSGGSSGSHGGSGGSSGSGGSGGNSGGSSGSSGSGSGSPADAGTSDATLADAMAVEAGAVDSAVFTSLQRSPAWGASYVSGDPLNPTPAVLAGYGDGIVIAGASADPKVVGVFRFDSGIQSEAFVARLQHNGQAMWSAPLVSAGMPVGVGVDGSGNVLVTAPYLPGFPTVSPDRVGPDLFLAKFGGDGTPAYQKHLVLTGTLTAANDGISETGLALDSIGAIYIGGGVVRGANAQQDILLIKYDPNGNQVWAKTFIGDPGAQVSVAAIATVAGDDVVITGGFTGHFDFGGGPLVDVVDAGFAPLLGFVARFTAAGAYVSSAAFGGPTFNYGSALGVSGGGDVLLSGIVTGPATVGGMAVAAADTTVGSPFFARLDRSGAARWTRVVAAAVPAGSTPRAVAVDRAQRAHLTGQLGGHVVVESFDSASGASLGTVPVSASDAGASVNGYGLATDSTQSLWLSGTFDTQATFGNVMLAGSSAGVFLVRLDPGGP